MFPYRDFAEFAFILQGQTILDLWLNSQLKPFKSAVYDRLAGYSVSTWVTQSAESGGLPHESQGESTWTAAPRRAGYG